MAEEQSVLLYSGEALVCRLAVGVVGDLETIFVLGTPGVCNYYWRGVIHSFADLRHVMGLVVIRAARFLKRSVHFLGNFSMKSQSGFIRARVIEVLLRGSNE